MNVCSERKLLVCVRKDNGFNAASLLLGYAVVLRCILDGLLEAGDDPADLRLAFVAARPRDVLESDLPHCVIPEFWGREYVGAAVVVQPPTVQETEHHVQPVVSCRKLNE